MLADAPNFETDNNDGNNETEEVIDLREETTEDFEQKLKKIFG